MLDTDLDLLRAFVVTAAAPTFAAAARELRVTVSAVSLRMKALEAQLGVPLFERVGRRAQLTAAGQALLAEARGPLEQLAEASARAVVQTHTVAGVVRVGGPRAFVCHALSAPLAELLRAHPALTVELVFDVPSALERRLAEGSLDLAVMARPHEHPSLEAQRLGQETFVALAAPRHPLTRGRATADALSAHGVVVFDADLAMHAPWWHASFGRRVPLPPLIRAYAGSLDAMLALIEEGAVWGVLPSFYVADARDRGRVVELPPLVARGQRAPRPATYPLALAWRRRAALTARFTTVRDALLAHGRGLPRATR